MRRYFFVLFFVIFLSARFASADDVLAKANSKLDTTMPITIYLASPLGFAESTKSFMKNELIPSIKGVGVTVINPWDADGEINRKIDEAKSINDPNKRRAAWREIIQLLGRANAKSIEQSDGVVAVLDGVDVDSGTAAEIGYATALGKWVIGYRGDFRRTGEDVASEVNLQVEYFIYKSGGSVVHSLADLVRELRGKIKTAR